MARCRGCGRSGGELTENGCPACGPDAEIRPTTGPACACGFWAARNCQYVKKVRLCIYPLSPPLKEATDGR